VSGPERGDDDFEAYLQQRSILPHRLASTERFEPSPELDRLVLARAKEAIRSSEPAPVYRPARWALPFGLAATLVLAFAVVLHMRGPTSPVTASAPRAPLPAPISADEAPAATIQAQADSSHAAALDLAGAAAESQGFEPAKESLEQTARLTDSRPDPLSAPPPSPPPASPARAEARLAKTEASKPTIGQEAARGLSETQQPDLASAQAAAIAQPYDATQEEAMVTGAPHRDRELASVSSVRVARRDIENDGDAAVDSNSAAADTPSATGRAGYEPAPLEDAAAAATFSKTKAVDRSDPARWFEHIQRLTREGKTAEADRELAAFRKAFPNYPTDSKPPR
jgi:hypothetical protein